MITPGSTRRFDLAEITTKYRASAQYRMIEYIIRTHGQSSGQSAYWSAVQRTVRQIGSTVFLPISAPPKNNILEQEVLL